MFVKAKRLGNMTHSVICKSVNKLLMGKTYWKNVVLPSLLQSSEVMPFTNKEIQDIQVIENGVLGKILGARKGTPISVLRGEIGSSLMKRRIMETKLMYVKSITEGKNELLKEFWRKSRKEKNNPFTSKINNYLEEINLSYKEFSEMSKREIKNVLKEWDTKQWEEDMKSKRSIHLYRSAKKAIRQ